MFGLMMSIVALAFVVSCEKEEVKVNETVASKDKLKDTQAPNFAISVSSGSFCGSKTPCGTVVTAFTKNNMVEVTNLYHSWFSGVTYTFYKRISVSGSVETFQPISGAQYYCTSVSPQLANSGLPNNTRVLVFANVGTTGPSMSTNLLFDTNLNNITNHPSITHSDFAITTTGYYKGNICGGGDEPPPCSDCSEQ